MSYNRRILPIATDVLGILLPMHLVFDHEDQVVSVGPVLEGLIGKQTGQKLHQLIGIRRPKLSVSAENLLAAAGKRLMVDLILPEADDDPQRQRLRGVVLPLNDGRGLLQLAFGTDLAQAVQTYKLTEADFSPTDYVLEILYLLEAQSLIRGEMEGLMDRLDQARQNAEQEAVTDGLTGLQNRRAFERTIQGLIASSGKRAFGVMGLDLDHFKSVNDTLGHAAGDAVLVEVGKILREETRAGDQLFRMGGDEFLLLLPDCTEPELLASIAARIIERLEKPIPINGAVGRISGSIGISMSIDYTTPTADRILSDADAALYRAKDAGRACYQFHGRDAPDGT